MAQISPWDGFPKTHVGKDEDGKLHFIVMARVLTPFRAKAAENLATLLATGLMVGGFAYSLVQAEQPELWHWIAAAILPWILIPLIRGILGVLLAKETKIVLTERRFEIHGRWRRRVFDRTLPHTMSLVMHDAAEAEARSNDLKVRQAARRGKIIQKTPYYGDSAVVSYNYLGQRNDVLVAYPKQIANAVLMRLKACDAALDQQLGTGGGVATDPSDQWTSQPGDLPDD